MAYKVVMKPTSVIESRLGLNPDGEIQKFFTETCAEYMDPYVPFRSGALADYIIVGNEIWYDQEYAQYQYYGARADLSHLIMTKNRTRTDHPLATSYWDRYMWTAHKEDIIRQVQNKIDKG